MYIIASSMEHESNFNLSSAARLLILAGIVIVAFLAVRIYHSTKSTTQQTAVYTSEVDAFKVTFPIKPSVQSSPARSDGNGGTETGRLYSAQVKADNSEYAIYVNKYSNITTSNLDKAHKEQLLEGYVAQLAQSDSSKLSNAKFSTFNNQIAANVTLTPASKSDATTQLVAFWYDNKLYMLLGSNATATKFKTFTSSFHLQ
jgi:hypothetical protein